MMRRVLLALVAATVAGCGDGAASLDASCPIGADAAVADAALADAALADAAPDAATLLVRWTFTENGMPVTVPGDARSVIVTRGDVPIALGATREEDHQLVVPAADSTLRFVTTDSNSLPMMITFARVPPGAETLDVVLPYITEPRAQLADLAARVKSFHEANATLPASALEGSLHDCCTADPLDNVCADEPGRWTGEPWTTLGFAPAGAHRFHYSIASAGAGAAAEVTLRAQADWDCDGVLQTWSIHGRIDGSGNLVYDPLHIDRPTE
jgi:hypothetical protein